MAVQIDRQLLSGSFASNRYSTASAFLSRVSYRCKTWAFGLLARTWSAVTRIYRRARHKSTPRIEIEIGVFRKRFEELIDLLCVSANEGIREDRATEYRQIRKWMRTHYPRVSARILRCWRIDNPNAVDPFLALYQPLELSDVINSEAAIDNILRSHDALEASNNSAKTLARH